MLRLQCTISLVFWWFGKGQGMLGVRACALECVLCSVRKEVESTPHPYFKRPSSLGLHLVSDLPEASKEWIRCFGMCESSLHVLLCASKIPRNLYALPIKDIETLIHCLFWC